MKKKLLVMLFLMLFAVSIASAAEIQFTHTAINSKVRPGGVAEFELKIQNDQAFPDELKIRAHEFDIFPFSPNIKIVVFGEAEELEYRTTVGTDSVRIVPIKITILDDVKPDINYKVKLDVESIITGKKYDYSLVVSVISPEDLVGISTTFPDKIIPGKDVGFRLSLSGNANVVLEDVEVVILSELFEQRISTPVFFKKTTFKDVNFDLGSDIRPGTYTLSIKAYQERNLIGSLTREFQVVKNPDIVELIEVSKGFLSEEISIRKNNNGNLVIEESIIYPVTSFSKLFTKTTPEPNREEAGRLVWIFELKPNQSFEVSVKVDYTSLFILIVALLIGALIGIYYYNKKVIIIKSSLEVKDDRGGLSELKIQLHIKNRDSSLRNVEILDIVPNIVKPTKEFGTLKPEGIQSGPKGRRLVWKIKRLNKGEERVISYKLKSELKIVGSLLLPPAIVRYRKGRKKYEYKSNRLIFFSTRKKS